MNFNEFEELLESAFRLSFDFCALSDVVQHNFDKFDRCKSKQKSSESKCDQGCRDLNLDIISNKKNRGFLNKSPVPNASA